MSKLFRQSPRRIGKPQGQPAADRVPDSLAHGSPDQLRLDLEELLGTDRVLSRLSDLVRYAADASPYRSIPQIVVAPRDVHEMAAVLRYCNENGRRATFRAGGTSLCGQSQGDDIIIDTREHWTGMRIEGDLMRVRPGTILSHANAILAREGRQLGPDPASASAACIGGVLSNNAAGMRCTPERSAYATLKHARFVLPTGHIINTEDANAEEQFEQSVPQLAQGLSAIRSKIIADDDLVEKIRSQSSIRNTTGYAMQAFLDADTPLQIYKKLITGSEGTLGFIAEAVMETVEIPAITAVCWV